MRQVAYPLDLAMLKSESSSERTPLGLISASNDGSRATLDMQFAVRKDAFLGDIEEFKSLCHKVTTFNGRSVSYASSRN